MIQDIKQAFNDGVSSLNQFISEENNLSQVYQLAQQIAAGFNNGKKIIRVPRNLLSVSLSSNLSPKVFINGTAKYYSDICDTINGVICEVNLDDYTLVNMLVKYKLYDNLSLKFRIENMLNQSYQTVYNFGTSQRAFYLGLDNVF